MAALAQFSSDRETAEKWMRCVKNEIRNNGRISETTYNRFLWQPSVQALLPTRFGQETKKKIDFLIAEYARVTDILMRKISEDLKPTDAKILVDLGLYTRAYDHDRLDTCRILIKRRINDEVVLDGFTPSERGILMTTAIRAANIEIVNSLETEFGMKLGPKYMFSVGYSDSPELYERCGITKKDDCFTSSIIRDSVNLVRHILDKETYTREEIISGVCTALEYKAEKVLSCLLARFPDISLIHDVYNNREINAYPMEKILISGCQGLLDTIFENMARFR